MSAIVEFYKGNAHDNNGRYLHHLLGISNGQLERSHDLIQWLFPTTLKSHFNPDAPVLTEEDITAFKADQSIQENLRAAYKRFVNFLGLQVNEEGKVVKGDHFAERYDDCWGYWNHNFLRITRAISSLRTLGLLPEAWALYEGCVEVARNEGVPITDHTFAYWKAAVTGNEMPKFGG